MMLGTVRAVWLPRAVHFGAQVAAREHWAKGEGQRLHGTGRGRGPLAAG